VRPHGLAAERPASELHRWLAEHDPLVLVAERNPVLETLGHDPRSAEADAAWLHRLGPAAMSAHRRIVLLLEAVGDGHAVPLAALASDLGLPGGTGHNTKIVRTLARLVHYGIATPRGQTLAINLALPPTRRLTAQLEATLIPPPPDLRSTARSNLRRGATHHPEVTPDVAP
jgi:hypothetical protein